MQTCLPKWNAQPWERQRWCRCVTYTSPQLQGVDAHSYKAEECYTIRYVAALVSSVTLFEPSQAAASIAPQQLTCPLNADKLKKHITLMCDRLHKGMRPSGRDALEPSFS